MSLSNPASLFYLTKAAYLLKGNRSYPSRQPYLSLSGTSMASPVVAGTVALMLQANPNLTPNLVKAILQYTAQTRHYDALTQGAGFLNAKGAVELARYFKSPQAGQHYPHSWMWSQPDHLGQPPHQGRRDQAGGQRVGLERGLGRARRRPGREHRLGHALRRRLREHRVGHRG